MHADELAVDSGLVRRLIRRELPGLAGLSLRPVPAPGSSNVLYRLGRDLVVRLLRDGRLVAVLDFGGLALGHPSVDLIAAWETMDPSDRDRFRSSLSVSDADWQRGRAWAFAIAIMSLTYYWNSMPGRCRQRLVMAQAVLGDFTRNG